MSICDFARLPNKNETLFFCPWGWKTLWRQSFFSLIFLLMNFADFLHFSQQHEETNYHKCNNRLTQLWNFRTLSTSWTGPSLSSRRRIIPPSRTSSWRRSKMSMTTKGHDETHNSHMKSEQDQTWAVTSHNGRRGWCVNIHLLVIVDFVIYTHNQYEIKIF